MANDAERKHIRQITGDKSALEGSGPGSLKPKQFGMEKDGGGQYRLAYRDPDNVYHVLADRADTATGVSGETGIQGETGAQGHTGPPGPAGFTGVQGITGPIGLAGTGIQGITGIQGVTGFQGLTGIQGETGLEGDQGETGLPGITGVANFTRGSTFPQNPTDRQLYWDNEDEIVYFYNSTAGAWVDISSGAIGATGPQGSDGATGTLNVVLNGGGSTLTTGVKGDIRLPYDLQFDSWTLLGGETGSALIGLWKDTYANFPPTSADAMHSGATGPTLVGEIKNQDTNLSDWLGTTAAKGDIVRVNIDSVSSCTLLSLSLDYHKL